MKNIQVTIDLEVPDNVGRFEMASWIYCYVDNISYEKLRKFVRGLININDVKIINVS